MIFLYLILAAILYLLIGGFIATTKLAQKHTFKDPKLTGITVLVWPLMIGLLFFLPIFFGHVGRLALYFRNLSNRKGK